MARNKSFRSNFVNQQSLVGFVIGAIGSILMFLGINSLGAIFGSDEQLKIETASSALGQEKRSELTTAFTLKEIMAVESPSRRKALLHVLLQQQNEEQIVKLIQKPITFDTGRRLYSVQNQIFQELSHISPDAALEQIWRIESDRWPELISIVFFEWALLDFGEALTQATALEGSLRRDSVSAVLSSRIDLFDTELDSLAKEHGFESIARKYKTAASIKKHVACP